MIISIENNLKDIKYYLISKGFDVHDTNESIASDVYIYSNELSSFSGLYNKVVPISEGSLIIDASNKSFDEIESIIDKRSYTPLF
jgi:hypothetical protein